MNNTENVPLPDAIFIVCYHNFEKHYVHAVAVVDAKLLCVLS